MNETEPTRVVTVRMSPSQHERIKEASRLVQFSMNKFCLNRIMDGVNVLGEPNAPALLLYYSSDAGELWCSEKVEGVTQSTDAIGRWFVCDTASRSLAEWMARKLGAMVVGS